MATATAKRMGLKLNRELRKAVHSGDGYDDYMTIYQFLQAKVGLIKQRMAGMERSVDSFYEKGGKITMDSGSGECVVTYGDVCITVIYDAEGDVTDYSVRGLKGRREVLWFMLGLFFCVRLIPVYRGIIAQTEEQLANLDNDNVLRGMSEIRDLIRGDKYLTVAAIGDMDVSAESVDPFDLFPEAGE